MFISTTFFYFFFNCINFMISNTRFSTVCTLLFQNFLQTASMKAPCRMESPLTKGNYQELIFHGLCQTVPCFFMFRYYKCVYHAFKCCFLVLWYKSFYDHPLILYPIFGFLLLFWPHYKSLLHVLFSQVYF